MRTLFLATEMAAHVAAVRTHLGLAAEADPTLLAASTRLIGEVATY